MNLERLAQWINTHDDGTAQPRATVSGDAVDLRSTLYHADGSTEIETVRVSTMGEARDVLGY